MSSGQRDREVGLEGLVRLTAVVSGVVAAGSLGFANLFEDLYADSAEQCDLGSLGAVLGGLALGLVTMCVTVLIAAVLAHRWRVLFALPLALVGAVLAQGASGLPGPAYTSSCGNRLPLLAALAFGLVVGGVTYLLARRRPL